MNCGDVRRQIEDYHEGELPGEVAAEVAAHASACFECGRELRLLRAEDSLYRAWAEGLADQLSGEPVIWERVKAATGRPSPGRPGWVDVIRSVMSPPRRLAFALLLVVLSVAGTLLAIRIINEPQDESMLVSGKGRDFQSAMRSIARAEKEYENAIRLLSDIVEKRKATLDPRLMAELERNLQAIDENITATRRAFREHPSDPEYALYMLAAYARKVDLLQEVVS